ncbi:MAG: hypothetical protein M1837_006323 [Sclerophora amabilis]|nr:MAG: hypothetical protein M1837_006323 [Sclerophora amabilis]
MPRKQWIDKKSATTFALVHRAQNDPRIHDAEASSMVFTEVAPGNRKGETKTDLEEDLGLDPTSIRDNEGEAANHGIFYDDTDYDYMQHLRDLGGNSEAQFVEAPQLQSKQKGKNKQKLEDALRDATLEDEDSDGGVKIRGGKPQLDADILPSKDLRRGTYQDQQDVPDILAGFQPDMDPRLREVLEALEDDAYVDEEDAIFGELAKDGQEVSQEAFEETGFEEDLDDGWETDDTAKPGPECTHHTDAISNGDDMSKTNSQDNGDGDWMAEFSKFKKAEKTKPGAQPSNSELQSSLMTSSSVPGERKKKRKGALTSSTGYSMTSSSLFRTEGHTLLDDRFDKIEESYAEDDVDDGVSIASSSASQGPVRSDFDSMMDDFLGGYSMSGRKRVKKGGYQSGMEQLNEIRQGLGPARVKPQKI